jgi:hypothetical protein
MIHILMAFLIEGLFAQSYQSTTIFKWAPSDKAFEGTCYEIDRETMGQRYISKVRRDLCRPEKKSFVWVKNTPPPGGKCYEVDEETKGQKYAGSAPPDKCAPEKTTYIQKNVGTSIRCYQVDALTMGEEYVVNATLEKCRPSKENTKYKWFAQSSFKGECYLVDEASEGAGFREKVADKFCEPRKTRFVFVSSKCYEVDAIEGSENYVKEVKIDQCEKGEVSFAFVKNDDMGGECFRVSEGGTRTQTSINDCRPHNVSKNFIKISKTRGRCVEFDSETSGEKYMRILPVTDCRPEKTHYAWVNNANAGGSCFEVDSDTGGEQYINISTAARCSEDLGVPTFVPDTSYVAGGTCISKKMMGSKVTEERKALEACRTEKTIFRWIPRADFVGDCYEIDDSGNPRIFSMKVSDEKCKPTNFDYYFYKENEKSLGQCYQVDPKNRERGYSRKVTNTYCKESLGL